ncbi:uncharacterized protein [Drosophila bipectinata]|uniref:uncharacterized protein n=1 Tax=Drosophila bipectinata TaxID=42026 RepID=UPI001C8A807D|nr:uncharacterized protein LOC108125625 [Drosophila bipectinata]
MGFLYSIEAPYVKLTNVVCEVYNKSWVAVHYCRLKAYSRNKTSLHINATVFEPANNISVRIKFMKRANGYKPFLYDFVVDGCQFMRKRNQPVAKIIWNLIKDVSTVNHSCPYVGYQAISDFYITNNLPVVLPTGDYLLMLTWIFYGKRQFATNVYFRFVEDLTSQN